MNDEYDEMIIEAEEDAAEEEEEVTEKRSVFADQKDPEIESLYKKYKKGKLILQPPDFQRRFVWDKQKSSRLIESALLDIPIPPIYIFVEPDGSEVVIDGQQRLTAFFSFIDNGFPDEKKQIENRDFKLIGLKVFRELNNKSFKELSENFQEKIHDYKIRTISFIKESDPELKYQVYERLNTGSVQLNDQELRNCIFRGKYNDLLNSLADDNKDFKYILGIENAEKRMKDVELVLRFAAFYHTNYLEYKSPMKSFLNKEMVNCRDISKKEMEELKEAFKNAVQIIKSLLDRHAFRRFNKGDKKSKNGKWEPKAFNASLYDILMNSFSKKDKNEIYRNLDSIKEALIDLMSNNQEFNDSILISTSSTKNVVKRFDIWRKTLDDIIGNVKAHRCFSYELKKELYDKNPTCAICGQKIHNIDDAAVDHIQQYWKGGQTIPENARLTHRYCNWARARND